MRPFLGSPNGNPVTGSVTVILASELLRRRRPVKEFCFAIKGARPLGKFFLNVPVSWFQVDPMERTKGVGRTTRKRKKYPCLAHSPAIRGNHEAGATTTFLS